MPRNDSYINMHVRKVLHANHWPAVRRAGWLATLSLTTREHGSARVLLFRLPSLPPYRYMKGDTNSELRVAGA